MLELSQFLCTKRCNVLDGGVLMALWKSWRVKNVDGFLFGLVLQALLLFVIIVADMGKNEQMHARFCCTYIGLINYIYFNDVC